MKTKFIPALALMLAVGAFLLPASVLADDVPEEPGQLATPEPSPRPASADANVPGGRPFTPDGQATVTDNATSDDAEPSGASKEFFTFTTPGGNVFFLVVDRSRATDNVYFLNAVTERDLLALAERSGNADDDIFAPPLPAPTLPDDDDGDGDETAPPIESEPTSNNGTVIFIIIAVLAFGGAAYYLKIARPKKQGAAFDDEDEEYEDEEEVLVDDEPEEDTRKDREFPDDNERLVDEIS